MVFEFIIAAILFFGIIIYTMTLINQNVTSFRDDSFHNDLELRSIQISEIILHHPWTSDVWGFSDGWMSINRSAPYQFGQECSNYAEILEMFNLNEAPYLSAKPNHDLRILIKNSTDILLDCMDPGISSLPTNRYVAHTQRFSVLNDGSIVSVNVWVW